MVNTEIIGFIGALLIIIAYFPQINYIIKEHCSGGISIKAWLLWLVATILILIHAINTGDRVFMSLQLINLIAIVTIIGMVKFYGGRICRQVELKMKKKMGKKK